MPHLLDTNILSEACRPRPNPQVLAWLSSLAPDDGFVSTVSIGEIHRGIVNLRQQNPEKAERIERWLSEIEQRDSQILDVTIPVAKAWGELSQKHPKRDPVDLLIAATAAAHGLTVATRNIRDFDGLGIPLLNPFELP